MFCKQNFNDCQKVVSIKKRTKVTQIACKISIETRPRSFSLKINLKKKYLPPSLISQSYDQYYCVNWTGVDEEDWVGEVNRKKALAIIYRKHSPPPPLFYMQPIFSIKKKNLTSVRSLSLTTSDHH